MESVNLKSILNNLKTNAEWFGLRKVYESNTYRIIRDGNPQANVRDFNRGLMIEVLAEGQFGYYGTNKFDAKTRSVELSFM